MSSCRKLAAAVWALSIVLTGNAWGQHRGIRLGEETTSTWRFGVSVKAVVGPATGIQGMLPVPMDWPEQTVKQISEQKSENIGDVTFRVLDNSARQMIVTVPRLGVGEEASAFVTLQVIKRRIEAPEETNGYQPPRPSPALAKFLTPSPYIESRDAKIGKAAQEASRDQVHAWDRVASMFDWVRANVKYEFAEQIKPATAALKDGVGDCEELSSLVIAMCRSKKIPARAVWVPGHTYPEFCLADEKGNLHWFPCQAAGAERQFGSMLEDRPILQKGDNFLVPGERTPARYLMQSLSAKDTAGPLEVKFFMLLEPAKE